MIIKGDSNSKPEEHVSVAWIVGTTAMLVGSSVFSLLISTVVDVVFVCVLEVLVDIGGRVSRRLQRKSLSNGRWSCAAAAFELIIQWSEWLPCVA